MAEPAKIIELENNDIVIVQNDAPATILEKHCIISKQTVYGSNTFDLIASSAIGGDRLIGVVNGYAVYADSDLGIPAIGISTNAVNAGDNVAIAFAGKRTITSANFNTNQPVFLGVNGLLTQTAPTTGILQRIGIAQDSNNLIIDISQSLVLT